MEHSSRRKKLQALAPLELSADNTSKLMGSRAAALKRLSERANNTSCSSTSLSAPPTFSGSLVDPSSPRKISLSFSELGQAIIARLQSYGVRIDPGLSDEEIELAQAAFQITFPPDLRGILQQGLPIGPGFPDWRSQLGSHKLKLWIAAPKTGLCSAAELGLFWWRGWGARPPEPEGAARASRAALRRAPVMVPVFSQCYVPSQPVRAGNPVMYVDRSEAFYCAHELSEFFGKECFKRFVSGGGGGGGGCGSSIAAYCPEPMAVQQQEPRVLGVESARKMIARCVSNIGEDLEGLEAALAERRSSVSARSVLAGPRASSTSRSSDGSSDDHEPGPSHHHPSSLHLPRERLGHSSSNRGGGMRRIEFWSDLVEKGPSMNAAAGRSASHDDGFVQVGGETDLDWENAKSNPWQLVKESVGEMAIKLRRAGWNERDVAEIMDSCEQLDHRCDDPRPNPADRESVIEGLAAHLDFLSSCLHDAGWSIHDISETLYSDLTGFSEHPGRRARISPEVASRIGLLAAFVAQG
ncbi:hypothetical protein SELMODRAFT_429564 [Selaginella moellendorffii]|uniref:Knr4/Smi1-like domain-containing protein n=1 Tax=Selaginella moellendorffii TaxID=88036 RepID=D8T6K9_SELML|nr:hypothetical protein SELMODRAFT_429564 [Selaginella moellendorffii]